MIKEDVIQSILAIVIIGILGLVAIAQGINGQLYALCIIAIAGLGGYEVYRRNKGSG